MVQRSLVIEGAMEKLVLLQDCPHRNSQLHPSFLLQQVQAPARQVGQPMAQTRGHRPSASCLLSPIALAAFSLHASVAFAGRVVVEDLVYTWWPTKVDRLQDGSRMSLDDSPQIA